MTDEELAREMNRLIYGPERAELKAAYMRRYRHLQGLRVAIRTAGIIALLLSGLELSEGGSLGFYGVAVGLSIILFSLPSRMWQ